jgi:hypothetical protein
MRGKPSEGRQGVLASIAEASATHVQATVRMTETVLADRSHGWTWARIPIAALAWGAVAVVAILALVRLGSL